MLTLAVFAEEFLIQSYKSIPHSLLKLLNDVQRKGTHLTEVPTTKQETLGYLAKCCKAELENEALTHFRYLVHCILFVVEVQR